MYYIFNKLISILGMLVIYHLKLVGCKYGQTIYPLSFFLFERIIIICLFVCLFVCLVQLSENMLRHSEKMLRMKLNVWLLLLLLLLLLIVVVDHVKVALAQRGIEFCAGAHLFASLQADPRPLHRPFGIESIF